jgi:hypothetical protein
MRNNILLGNIFNTPLLVFSRLKMIPMGDVI